MPLTSQREIGNKNKVRIYLENPCPMEMVWVLVNQYKWKITLTNSDGIS